MKNFFPILLAATLFICVPCLDTQARGRKERTSRSKLRQQVEEMYEYDRTYGNTGLVNYIIDDIETKREWIHNLDVSEVKSIEILTYRPDITNINFRTSRTYLIKTKAPQRVMPKFQGGKIDKFRSFVASRLNYPPVAKRLGIEGWVYVEFVIEPDGSLGQIKILQSPHVSLSIEVVRVLTTSPRWEPGMKSGMKMRIKYTLPIEFEFSRKGH